jgi:hypothetical protein
MMKRTLVVVAAAVMLMAVPRPGEPQILGKGPEVSLGREAASQVEQAMPVDVDPVAVAKVRSIGRRLVSVAPEKTLPYEFHVVDGNEVNAFALPGGFVYVYRGLLQLLPNDDALAFVLGHELSHATQHHGMKQWEKNMGLALAMRAALGGTALMAQETLQILVGLKFSRDDEADADRHGIALLALAGYDPDAAAEAMLVVKRSTEKGEKTPALLRSHPAPEDRIRALRALSAEWKEKLASRQPVPPASQAAVALSAPAFTAPDPLAGESVIPAPCAFFPLKVGARWYYRLSGPDGVASVSVTVVEELPTRPGVFRVDRDLGRGIRFSQLTTTTGDRVLARAASGGAWQLEASFPLPSGALALQPAPGEPVRVPAGTFTALRIEQPGPDGKATAIAWYAPGVGLVRRQSLTTGVVEELERSVIPGGAGR